MIEMKLTSVDVSDKVSCLLKYYRHKAGGRFQIGRFPLVPISNYASNLLFEFYLSL